MTKTTKTSGKAINDALMHALMLIQQLEAAAAEPEAQSSLAIEQSQRIGELETKKSQLLTQIKQLEMERDAAVSDMKRAQGCICNICKNQYRPDPAVRRYECKILGKFSEIFDSDDGGALFCGRFEWRGVCPENTEVQE